MSIVTISHEMGAGGPEIGQQVAERLGYNYVDHELISDAARRYGLLEEKLEHLDESKPSLFERFDAETRRYITAMQTAFYEFAEQDRVVLMGRGGQWLLRGVSHVLRVRVMAPFDIRVKRLGDEARRAHGRADEPADRHRDGAARRHGEGGPHALSLRGGRGRPGALRPPDQHREAPDGRRHRPHQPTLVRRPELQTTPAAAQLVADRSLASQVQVALATNPETRKYRITVEAKAGVVTLEGTAAMDEALDVAKSVGGVREVKAQQVDIPPIPPFVA